MKKHWGFPKTTRVFQPRVIRTGTIYDPWTAALEYSPQPISVFVLQSSNG